jgi:hypothetical protein
LLARALFYQFVDIGERARLRAATWGYWIACNSAGLGRGLARLISWPLEPQAPEGIPDPLEDLADQPGDHAFRDVSPRSAQDAIDLSRMGRNYEYGIADGNVDADLVVRHGRPAARLICGVELYCARIRVWTFIAGLSGFDLF